MTRHSNVVGGSSAALRRQCNASIDEGAKVPRDHSIYAATGTCLHTIMEIAINDDLSDDEIYNRYTDALFADLLHEDIEIEAYGRYKITKAMIDEKIMPALDFFDRTFPRDAEIKLEERVNYEPWVSARAKEHPFENNFFINGAFGTSDVVFIDNETNDAGIVDWKFGDGHIVDPDNNDQMRFYLAGAIHSGLLPVQNEYTAWIFQPAAQLDEKHYARKAIYTFEDLKAFALDLKDAVEGERIHSPGPHCKFCKGKVVCSAHKDMLARVERIDIQGMNNKQIAAALEMIPSLKAYITELEAHALRNAQNGVVFPGFKLDTGLGNRTWKNPEAAWSALGRMGLSAADRTVKEPISPTQAIKLLKAAGVDSKQLDKFESRHVIRPETAERLVPAAPGEDGSSLTRLAKALEAA